MWDEVKIHARLTLLITGGMAFAGMILQLPEQPEMSLVMLALVIVSAMAYRQMSLTVVEARRWWTRRHAR